MSALSFQVKGWKVLPQVLFQESILNFLPEIDDV